MVKSVSRRILIGAAFSATVVLADTRFEVREMNPEDRRDIRPGVGQCDIRVRVDIETEIRFGDSTVEALDRGGSPTRDEGSECNYPLPRGRIRGFQFDVQDKNEDGDIRLVRAPSRATGWRAIVAIRDPEGGAGRYHFRIKWDLNGSWESGSEGGFWGDSTAGDSIAICQSAIRDRLVPQYGGYLTYRRAARRTPLGRDQERVSGRATYRDRTGRAGEINYQCRVDVISGRAMQAEYRVAGDYQLPSQQGDLSE